MNKIIIPKLNIEELRLWTTPIAMNKVVIGYHIINNIATQLTTLLNGSKLGLAIANSTLIDQLPLIYNDGPTRVEYYTTDRFDLASNIYQLYVGDIDSELPKYELFASMEDVQRRVRELPICKNYISVYCITHNIGDKPLSTISYTNIR